MKHLKRVVLTLASTGMLVASGGCSYFPMDHHEPTQSEATPQMQPATNNPHETAQDFIEHIHYARLDLAMHKNDQALAHIGEAHTRAAALASWRGESPIRIKAVRIAFNNTHYKYHYFPLDNDMPEHMKGSKAPKWAKYRTHVTDAQVVYLTLNTNLSHIDRHLGEARDAIRAGNSQEADTHLAKLTDEAVTVDDDNVPALDRARDNIALARTFVEAGNYEGARYALTYADDALDDLQEDDNYAKHHDAVVAMRQQIEHLQESINSKDPSAAQKASAKMGKWWHELKGWGQSS